MSAFNAALEGPLFHGRTVNHALIVATVLPSSTRLLLLLLFLIGSYRWTAHQRGARADYEGGGGGLG